MMKGNLQFKRNVMQRFEIRMLPLRIGSLEEKANK